MMARSPIIAWPAEPNDDLGLALWVSEALAKAMQGTASDRFQVSGVEIDSRDVMEGDLFFALRGESMDGHRFVDAAFAKGATAAVVDRPVDGPHVLVKDTTRALQLLAKELRFIDPVSRIEHHFRSQLTLRW